MLRNILQNFAFLIVASPAVAATSWDTSTHRGLSVFDLSSEGNQVILTCDPDHVFGDTSNGSLRISIDGAGQSSQLVIVDQGGNQARFFIEHDLVMEAKADPDEWAKMLKIVAAGGDFALVTSTGSAQFLDVDAIIDLSCN